MVWSVSVISAQYRVQLERKVPLLHFRTEWLTWGSMKDVHLLLGIRSFGRLSERY